MSRSKRKFCKVNINSYDKKSYWKHIRKVIKSQIKNCKDYSELTLKKPKEIVNDYDYIDYYFMFEKSDKEDYEKWIRK